MKATRPETHMRQIAPLLALTLALAPFAARAENGMCEYRHPAHPNWDFFASCAYSDSTEGTANLREVSVSNGSRFSTREDGGRHTVNGLAATMLERDGAQCWRTVAEDELICIYPADTITPADPPPAPAARDDAAIAPAVEGVSFGGGEAGYCLLAEAGALVEQGRCSKRENCLEIEAGAGLSCLVSYNWKSGRSTEMASAADWVTLDGAPVIKGDPGCVTDTGTGLIFCYATTAMTPETHPVLAQPADPVDEAPASPEPAAAPEGESGTVAPAGAE
jgi:hypothetical protein